jgi:hypothetical protein
LNYWSFAADSLLRGIEWLVAKSIEVPAWSTINLAAQKHLILGKADFP